MEVLQELGELVERNAIAVGFVVLGVVACIAGAVGTYAFISSPDTFSFLSKGALYLFKAGAGIAVVSTAIVVWNERPRFPYRFMGIIFWPLFFAMAIGAIVYVVLF